MTVQSFSNSDYLRQSRWRCSHFQIAITFEDPDAVQFFQTAFTYDDPDDGAVAENGEDDNKREDDGPEAVRPTLP